MSRGNSLGGGMQTGYPLLKANVYAAQLKAVPAEVAPVSVEKPVVVTKEKKVAWQSFTQFAYVSFSNSKMVSKLHSKVSRTDRCVRRGYCVKIF